MNDYQNNYENYETIAAQLKAIAHPVRLQILNIFLKSGTQNVSQLYQVLKMPQSTVSQHLAKLRSARIIRGNRKGLEIYYDITDDHIKNIIRILI